MNNSARFPAGRLVASLALCAQLGWAHAAGVSTPWGVVDEPAMPPACATLAATLTPVRGSIDAVDGNPSNSQPDTARIQSAIDACPRGQAVKLAKGAGGASGFLSGPLKLRSGVKLWIDDGVTLFASRNPADYDNGPGTCGTATTTDDRACRPFIAADATVGSGIVGGGAIDGRGGSLLTSGPNAGRRSWWDVAFQNKTEGLRQQNPFLIFVRDGADFTLYRVAVMNSPVFHVLMGNVTGVTAWGIKILSPSLVYSRPGYACPPNSTPDKITPATCFTPETVKNTDGFDPAQSSRVLLAYSYISTGDDHVAVKSHGKRPSSDFAFLHNHFYYGHGMSIGSETDAGLSNMVVDDLVIDGMDSPGGIGLRIKSDSSRGGRVDNVSYNRICMRNLRMPLIFDTFYRSADSGTRYPSFTHIRVSNVHSFGSRKFGGGELTFAGFTVNGVDNPLDITLDNVVFDGEPPTFAAGHRGEKLAQPVATHFTFGPGAVSFAGAIAASPDHGVTISGRPGKSAPLDCSAAFVPFSSVLPDSPI